MANTTWYGDGTATVAVGSRTVTGTDTGWLTEVAGLTPIKVGDKFGIHVGRPIVIEQIISDTELLLADDWPGPAQTDAPYKVELTSPTIAAVEAVRRLLASLSNGNLSSIAETSVGTDDLLIGIGPGVFSTINKADLVQGVDYDAWVANLAGRAAYNGAAAGFSVLVIDIGDGRSALYFKNSATSGDWSAPSYITGPVGPAGVNQRGNYSAGTAYSIRDIVQYGGSTWIAKIATTGNAPPTLPTTENTQWLLFARSGTPGVVDRGTYSGATAYAANDIVLNNGSTWIALQPTTGNAPPVLPTESNAYWRLLARKGTDGTGTGDVVGPSSATDNFPVAFDSTSGKLIKAITGAIAALHGLTPAADRMPYFNGGSSAALATLTSFGRSLIDDADAAAAWATLGAGQALAASGWQRLPSGLIVQWGGATSGSGGSSTVAFPTAFPNAVYRVVCSPTTPNTNTSIAFATWAGSLTQTNFVLNGRFSQNGGTVSPVDVACDFIAIGR
ncbi:fusion protein [Rhizobium pusense]|uniref:gp53-like domain-containing protein n=1 Tax=Agrobacterium pusense TaxID=648995 RepID=UPI001F2E4B07|nr:fusion protein [Agrobacterium pusense]MDH2092570.1 fusion protein [Agrobacterium pusense]